MTIGATEYSMGQPLPRTVIVDYYDSYTNNLLILLAQLYSSDEVLQKVVVIKADKYEWPAFKRDVLPNTDCVILSPGPGRPDRPSDIKFALELIRYHSVPVLGVCLGHQAIAVAFGGTIINTPKITHGHVVSVKPVSPASGPFASSVLQDAQQGFDAVVYNSLAVNPNTLPPELEVTAWSDPQNGSAPTIMGLAHRSFPIWGVQYHPESISSTRGKELIGAFIAMVNKHYGCPTSYPKLDKQLIKACTYRVAASVAPGPGSSVAFTNTEAHYLLVEQQFCGLGLERSTAEVYERLIRSNKDRVGEVWLDGKSPSRPTTTSLAAPSFAITYSLEKKSIELHRPNVPPVSCTLPKCETFWSWFNAAQEALARRTAGAAGGFRGGWTGWFTYEMKEESLAGYQGQAVPGSRVDALWSWVDTVVERKEDGAWIARGVVTDGGCLPHSDLLDWLHVQGVTFGISAKEFNKFATSVKQVLSSAPLPTTTPAAAFPTFHPRISGAEHMHRIDKCREAIRQGESYELNQTTSFIAQLEGDPYPTYLRLRSFNPAYYSCYLSFPTVTSHKGPGVHVISSSPERFLQITSGEIEMRPIKGTARRVKAGECVCTPGHGCGGKDKGSDECVAEGKRVDFERGRALSEDVKERAENLMIVDLIRSDLLSCCVPSTVEVPQLIALESYGVHNLVTTVRGQLAPHVGPVEALKRCFPPGSMTGAPKLRSVQLLDEFEARYPRGVYSGALGYISLCGSADLSVVIRTMVLEGNELSIGAGGAITWLSDREEEWKEVLTKVQSVVGVLEGV